MTKDTAFNGETTPRHTILCSDPKILCAKHECPITILENHSLNATHDLYDNTIRNFPESRSYLKYFLFLLYKDGGAYEGSRTWRL